MRNNSLIDRNLAENAYLCSKCGGKCCKTDSCFYMPEDFSEMSLTYLLEEFLKKDYLCIYLDTTNWFGVIRVRSKGWPRLVFSDKFEDKPCMLLTDSGCSLSYEKRPTGGKALIPSFSLKCKSMLEAEDILYAWLPYQKLLIELVKRLYF